MPSLKELDKQVKQLSESDMSTGSNTPASAPVDTSLKGRAMSFLKPPYVYFIVLFFVILGALYYTKPCYVLSDTIDPKTNKPTINYKMMFAYALGITILISFGAHPYIIKK
tara:strand:+ start:498 stop:830 length:333 start_codon:yes stop_codon:yes gene_type:complete